ncbi:MULTISPECIES: hypothetical protein [Methylosinus]|uniref:Uncharacterized protein n=1 Tax=Methylosinus trichosporium (strain ATCC 35070 / NCIMB 11131 / UNIQEM 75 / OB3b) TaxID=595536 RepID=A0A2D2CX05_METT3|nr:MULTISPECIES: hypothetical protein [Methylosinus]ATQ67291.1 hypothetical protein CQW49_04825 [Methylosinus trichosporium OB3b]OBS52087.1 hypothetical protein A8B73_13005 [Methylosinus sp. 3S-1]
MKKTICVVAGLMISASTAPAGTATLKRTIDETQLQGYVATPPAGWAPTRFVYGAATPIGSASPAVYAISRQSSLLETAGSNATPPTAPPPPSGLTLISLSRNVLTKENLPDAVQVKASDCNLLVYGTPDTCPALYVVARPSAALPGALVVMIIKPVLYKKSTSPKYWEYVFDPSAVGAERWLLVKDGLADKAILDLLGDESIDPSGVRVGSSEMNIPGQTFKVADPNWLLFKRQSPTVVQAYQIAPK